MTQQTLHPTTSTTPASRGAHAAEATKPKSLRYKIGLGLLILYPCFYLAIPVAPLLPASGASQAAFAGGAVAVGEVVLLVAIALMGKEGYRAVKAKLKARLSRGAR